MEYQMSCLYDTEWQGFRISLLAKYNDYGGFGTIRGVEINLSKLRRYIEESADLSLNEEVRRVWRVTNLLNATLMGYGKREKFKDQAALIRLTITKFSEMHQKNSSAWWALKQTDWDWPSERRKLQTLFQHNKEDFDKIYDNLNGRRTKTEKKGMMHNRPELLRYLTIMEEVSGK